MVIRSEFVIPVNVIVNFTHIFQMGFSFFVKKPDQCVHFFFYHAGGSGSCISM